jgi:23S rRNA (guanine745-N1)-methyltransferase
MPAHASLGGRPQVPTALADAAGRLGCPHCGARLSPAGAALVCSHGHSFDVARDGHVSLLPPGGIAGGGDSSEMVAARAAFLAAGHYDPISDAVVATARADITAPPPGRTTILDVGSGPGHHLALLVDAFPDSLGLALDASPAAARRAARAHPRIAAIRCDVWHGLPLQDASVDVAVNLFAPRNGRELARVLAPEAPLVVVTPTPRHLHPLVGALGLLGIQPAKEAGLRASLPAFVLVERQEIEFAMTLAAGDVAGLVGMGPSARHVSTEEILRRSAQLPDPCDVVASVIVSRFRLA